MVAALVRDAAGRILLSQRRADQSLPLCWEFPGGKVEPGEAPEVALVREIGEELGCEVKVGGIFEVVFHALENSWADLNALAAAINQGVPVYASKSAQENLDKALRALVPFADNLGDLLILNKADWDRLIGSGDTVLQTIADRPDGLHDLVLGLHRYVYKLSGNPCTTSCGLTDGSGAAGFANFMGGTTQQEFITQVCGAVPLALRNSIPVCRGGT